MTRTRTRDTSPERGAVILLVAISMVALLIMTGLVLDLGVKRNIKRTEQAASDSAALAAGYHLSGRGNAAVVGDPRAACRAALDSVKRTLSAFPATATLPCDTLPETNLAPHCTNATPQQNITATGTSPWTLRVDYPVPAADIVDATLAGGAGAADGETCERMRVSLERTEPTTFSKIIGVSSLTTRAEAVVRGGLDSAALDSIPAFLLLERRNCEVLRNSASGSGSDGVIIREVSADEGGRIHSDSDGSSCASNSFVIDSNTMSGGGPGVTVDTSSGGAVGKITTYATALGSARGAGSFPGGVSTAATPGPIVSRRPFDIRFNPTTRPGISNLHSRAWSAVTMTPLAATAAGYTVLGCGADGFQGATKIFIDCNNYSPRGAWFPFATDVIVNGRITLGNNRALDLASVRRFYVQGNGSNGIEVRNGGRLTVNIGPQVPWSASCANRVGPGAGGTTTNTTEMVVFGGDLDVSGTARLCQTTVYLAASGASYMKRTDTAGSPNCTVILPCPTSGSGMGGGFEVGGGNVDWSAPNQLTGPADAAQPFEDLALWGETSSLSAVKSGGTLIGTGVFFLANGPMQFQSPASTQPRNAQWIARTVQFNQGTLVLKPTPADSVAVPQAGDWHLIR